MSYAPSSKELHPLAFNPHAYILGAARHENIVAIPDKFQANDHILRWYPHHDTWDYIATTREAETCIATRNRHLAMLQSLGDIAVPKYWDFIGNSPTFRDEVVIYSVVEEVFGHPISTPEHIAQTHGTLKKYYDWVEGSGEKTFLLDIFERNQYIAAWRKGVASPEVTLVDIDPFLRPTSESMMDEAREALREIWEDCQN